MDAIVRMVRQNAPLWRRSRFWKSLKNNVRYPMIGPRREYFGTSFAEKLLSFSFIQLRAESQNRTPCLPAVSSGALAGQENFFGLGRQKGMERHVEALPKALPKDRWHPCSRSGAVQPPQTLAPARVPIRTLVVDDESSLCELMSMGLRTAGGPSKGSEGQAAPSAAEGASGLGLSIVQSIAEAHGGRITVTSRPSRAEFALQLPLLHQKGQGDAPPS
jgi:hypothetical protein